MILRNYYNLMAALTLGVTNTDKTTFGDGHINVKDTIGIFRNASASGSYPSQIGFGDAKSSASATSSTSGGAIVFGTGTTAVTFDDYKLAAPISSGIGKASFNVTDVVYDQQTRKWTSKLNFVATNNKTESVTITEIGIYMYCSTDTLVYREVLSTPITIAAGESVTYTQSLEYQMPTV